MEWSSGLMGSCPHALAAAPSHCDRYAIRVPATHAPLLIRLEHKQNNDGLESVTGGCRLGLAPDVHFIARPLQLAGQTSASPDELWRTARSWNRASLDA